MRSLAIFLAVIFLAVISPLLFEVGKFRPHALLVSFVHQCNLVALPVRLSSLLPLAQLLAVKLLTVPDVQVPPLLPLAQLLAVKLLTVLGVQTRGCWMLRFGVFGLSRLLRFHCLVPS